jgi:hypothetical protein
MSAKPRDSDFRGEEANRDQGHDQKSRNLSSRAYLDDITKLWFYKGTPNIEINMISISIKGLFEMQEFHTNCIEIS